MQDISQLNINKAVQVLKDNLLFEDAKALETAEIIPSLYVLRYIQRIKQEIEHKDMGWEEFEQLCENYTWLGLFPKEKDTKLEFLKMVLNVAWDRKGKICDFDDSKFPHEKFGFCQCESHEDNGEPRKQEKLTICLSTDDDIKKLVDANPEYWCQNCLNASECEENYGCDMELEL